jgi:hypothetical protein
MEKRQFEVGSEAVWDGASEASKGRVLKRQIEAANFLKDLMDDMAFL